VATFSSAMEGGPMTPKHAFTLAFLLQCDRHQRVDDFNDQ
jgi:hypothetical protein